MQISEDLWSPVSFHMNKKLWFSQREIHKFSTIIFHSVEAEFLENQQIIISWSQGYLPLKYFLILSVNEEVGRREQGWI
jgi:hypothetical protein